MKYSYLFFFALIQQNLEGFFYLCGMSPGIWLKRLGPLQKSVSNLKHHPFHTLFVVEQDLIGVKGGQMGGKGIAYQSPRSFKSRFKRQSLNWRKSIATSSFSIALVCWLLPKITQKKLRGKVVMVLPSKCRDLEVNWCFDIHSDSREGKLPGFWVPLNEHKQKSKSGPPRTAVTVHPPRLTSNRGLGGPCFWRHLFWKK